MTKPVDEERYLVAGRYRLLEPLGVGSTAEVYRAVDTRLDRQVAVKVLTGTTDVGDPRRFANEVRMLAGLSHPNLVTAYDAGVDHDTPFVVLNLVEGHTLRDRVKQGPMPVDEVRQLGAVLADVLAYVHTREVVHRDLKPSNILIDAEGRPHLADFGLALLADDTRLTRTGQMVGTAAYLSPEQVRGTEVGVAADVYALGLVLLECLTGRREYPGPEIEAAVARLHRPPAVPDDLPDDLVRVLSLMTALKPGRRPTAAACAVAFRDRGTPLPIVPPSPQAADLAPRGEAGTKVALPVEIPQATPTAVFPRRRPSRKPLLLGGIALLAAIGTTVALTSGGSTPTGPAPAAPVAPTTTTAAPVVPIPAANTAQADVTQQVSEATVPVGQVPTTPAAHPAPAANHGAGNAGPGNNSSGGVPKPDKAKPPKGKDKPGN